MQTVMTRNGVNLAQSFTEFYFEALEEEMTVFSYGGWMKYSYFAVETGTTEDTEISMFVGYSAGDEGAQIQGPQAEAALGPASWLAGTLATQG